MRPLILAAILGAAVFAQHADEKPSTTKANLGTYRTILEFDVMSAKDAFSRAIGDGLTLRAMRERVVGLSQAGWSVSVTRARTDDNLLYHSLQLRGPHPSQLFAWHFADSEYWGADTPRILPVYGYPLELRIECRECRVTGKDTQGQVTTGNLVFQNEFTAGVVRIGLRRLKSPNPQQIR